MSADALLQDIRYAVRTLRRAPLFAATVAVTMGLGLGLLGSAFTLVNAYLLQPIDLPNARALYGLSWDTETARRHLFSQADYEALPPEAHRLATFAAAQSVSVMQNDVAMPGMLVTGGYFELLGTRPALGRLLRPADAAARGAGAVVVLSHHAWRSRFGSDPSIVGRRIQLGRQRFEVVGVTRPFESLAGQEIVNFFAPLTMAGAFPAADLSPGADSGSLVVVARLREGTAAAPLRAWFDVWLRQRYPQDSETFPVATRVDSLATRLPLDGVTLTLSTFILSAFGLVLLVASANVTNLMLARAIARQPEIAVRLALGASRWRVARQLIVESLVLAVPAVAAGLGLVFVAARVFPALIIATWPLNLPVDTLLVPLDPDWRVIAFLATAAVLSSVLTTLAPAGRLAGLRLAQVSRGAGSSDARGSRLRSGLVAMQIGACALFLVAAVGLLDESSRIANSDLNLDYERVSMVQIDPTLRTALAMRLATDAAVERVATTWKPPLMNGRLPTVRVTAPATTVTRMAGYTAASPEYFDMFDIQFVRGRTFTPAEAEADAPVAIVSAATAAALWPGLDAIGQTIEFAPTGRERAPRPLPRGSVRVIGVTEDVVTGTLMDGVDPTCVYLPTHVQTPADVSLLVQARSDDARAFRAALVRAASDVARDAPFQQLPMRLVVGGLSWVFGAFSTTTWVLGVVGLLFAAAGTYAVVSFLVAQRRREFGVRMALGASASQIVWGMVTETSRVAAIGLATGLVILAGLVRLLSSASALMPDFGVRPFLIGAVIVVAATAVAVLSPLRTAARTDPAQALRA